MYFGGRFAALNPSPPWCGCACTCKRACAPDMAQIDFSIRRAYGFLSEGGANPVRRRGPRGVFCFEMRLLANDSPAIWPRLYASTCLGAGLCLALVAGQGRHSGCVVYLGRWRFTKHISHKGVAPVHMPLSLLFPWPGCPYGTHVVPVHLFDHGTCIVFINW